MQIIKKILVPSDFSEVAAESYRYALQMAEELSASVHVLHSLPTFGTARGYPHVVSVGTQRLLDQAEEQISAFAEEGKVSVQEQITHPPRVYTHVSGFDLGEGIDRYVENQNVDLIIMGTNGIDDGWDRFFGSNAATLSGKVQPPILIVPANTEFHPLKKVCFATDLRISDVIWEERLGKKLAGFQPQIDFLHIELPSRKQTPELLEVFRKAAEEPVYGVPGEFKIIAKPEAVDGIFSYLEKHPYDLLVMVKSEREWWDRLFFSSYTKKSAGITNLPLLILEEKDAEI